MAYPNDKITFNELLIEAIINKNIDFIKDNIEKINFGNKHYKPDMWFESSVFSNLISTGFTEAFKIFFDRYIEQKDFIPFADEKFHSFIIQACHTSKPEILKYIHEKTPFDLSAHDKNKLGLIHFVFESFVSDSYIASDDDIFNMFLFLHKNKVNIFEYHPKSAIVSESLNHSFSRKYMHSIFSFLIVHTRFNLAIRLVPFIYNEKIISRNKKTVDVIKYLFRILRFSFQDRFSNINSDKKGISRNGSYDLSDFYNYEINFKRFNYEIESGYKILAWFLQEFEELTLDIFFENNFLFSIYDFYFLQYLNEKNINMFIARFKNPNYMKNGNSAMSSIIEDNFKKHVFFEIKDFVYEKFRVKFSDIISSSDVYFDDLVSTFQSQDVIPENSLLQRQIDFILSLDQDILNEKDPEKRNLSFRDFINMTIDEWIDNGFFNVSRI